MPSKSASPWVQIPSKDTRRAEALGHVACLWEMDEPFRVTDIECQAVRIFHIPFAGVMKSEASLCPISEQANPPVSLSLINYFLPRGRLNFGGSLIQTVHNWNITFSQLETFNRWKLVAVTEG